jgi:hypothetical protein
LHQQVYLNELMTYNRVPVPPTVMIAGTSDLKLRRRRWVSSGAEDPR